MNRFQLFFAFLVLYLTRSKNCNPNYHPNSRKGTYKTKKCSKVPDAWKKDCPKGFNFKEGEATIRWKNSDCSELDFKTTCCYPTAVTFCSKASDHGLECANRHWKENYRLKNVGLIHGDQMQFGGSAKLTFYSACCYSNKTIMFEKSYTYESYWLHDRRREVSSDGKLCTAGGCNGWGWKNWCYISGSNHEQWGYCTDTWNQPHNKYKYAMPPAKLTTLNGYTWTFECKNCGHYNLETCNVNGLYHNNKC